MIRFLLRASGFLLLAAAFASLVVDGTRSIAAQTVLQFPLGDTVAWLGGAGFRALLDRAAQWPAPLAQAFAGLLAVPSWIVTAVLGFALLLAGRPPRPRIGLSRR